MGKCGKVRSAVYLHALNVNRDLTVFLELLTAPVSQTSPQTSHLIQGDAPSAIHHTGVCVSAVTQLARVKAGIV